ncbi:MAG TPA: N-acetyl sugar amidotransferase [Flavobacteriales bacterium]|nr:N-acetyl sugar amidotransferase [Flavobacteriales bacterium]
MTTKTQICTRCVMDTTDPQIRFESKGICNHCQEYEDIVNLDKETFLKKENQLNSIVEEIKISGIENEYDCIIGISGGVDSTFLAYLVKEKFGLRPFAVHLDNGWNSKLAVKNIQNILRKLDIDLHTHVIDWEEFKNMQIAYFKASVIDIEAITDHSINAILYEVANDNNVKYILKGFNNATEKIMPKSWTFNKNDIENIQDIVSKHSNIEINTFPLLGRKKLNYYTKEKGIQTILPYNYMEFNKDKAKELIVEKLGWVDYGGKHYESIFTRFYQGYILPRKFGIDKRKAHFSNLICGGLLSRDEAIDELKKPPYEEDLVQEDYKYVVKKLGFSKEEFEQILDLPIKSHFKYKTDINSKIYKKLISPTNPLVRFIKKIK